MASPLRYSHLRIVFAGITTITLLSVTGCGSAIQNSGEDDSFIRQPGNSSSTKSKTKLKSGPLLPLKSGSIWRNRVMVRQFGVDAILNTGYEKAVVSSPVPLPGGSGNGLRIEMHSEKQNKLTRSETFKVDKRGISLYQIRDDLPLLASPPVPIVRYPIHEGEVAKWSGTIQISGNAYPALGYSRIRSPEEITTLQGKAMAYRVDTTVITSVNGRQVYFPMARWFVPGVGIVRQRSVAGKLDITRDIVSYKI